jgi:hypothetical protein
MSQSIKVGNATVGENMMANFRIQNIMIGLALALATFMLDVIPAKAQLEQVELKNPYTVSGELFVVRVVPAGRKMQIFVVGNEVSQLQFDKLHMLASIKAGTKIWSVEAGKKKDYFLIQTPSDLPPGIQPELNLKLQYKDSSENFDIKLDHKK